MAYAHGGQFCSEAESAVWSLRKRETTASRHSSDALTPLSSSAADLSMQVEFEPEESARLPPCVPDDVLARIRSEGQLKPGFQYWLCDLETGLIYVVALHNQWIRIAVKH